MLYVNLYAIAVWLQQLINTISYLLA